MTLTVSESAPGRELDVDLALIGHGEHNVGAGGGLESLQLDLQLVAADRKLAERVDARLVGDRCLA